MNALSRILWAALLTCVLASPTLAKTPAGSTQPIPPKLWTDGATATPLDPGAPVALNTFSTLARELSPAVISITTKRTNPGPQHPLFPMFRGPGAPGSERFGTGLGTGFVIHKDGYAVTNHHVIDGAVDIQVTLQDGTRHEAEIIGSWKPLDVALLKFKPSRPLVVAALGDSDNVAIGEWVVAIGNALGLNHTVTAGIVSAKGRREVQPGREPMMANFIQTDASINPGNSGGPLISTRGEVIGINTAINAAGQGIGFAVPINMIKTVLPQLATGSVKRAYLGVRVGPVDRGLAKKMGLSPEAGALIVEVLPGLPAAKAGIKPGDVVTAFNDKPIKHWEDLPWYASTGGTQEATPLKILRRGKTHRIPVTLTHYPDNQPASATAPGDRGDGTRANTPLKGLGLELAPLSRSQRRTLRLGNKRGVAIVSVARGSNAQRAGLQAGDVILQFNYEEVGSAPKHLAAKVARTKEGEIVSFLIRRERRQIFMAFPR
ncbi:MAG: trypsin-like peptidase domain-containing protein [Myxococcota bacterium]